MNPIAIVIMFFATGEALDATLFCDPETDVCEAVIDAHERALTDSECLSLADPDGRMLGADHDEIAGAYIGESEEPYTVLDCNTHNRALTVRIHPSEIE